MQQFFYALVLGLIAVISLPTSQVWANPTEVGTVTKQLSLPLIIAHDQEAFTEENSSPSLWQQLNLSPWQKHRIKQISRRYYKQIVQLKEDLQVAQKKLAVMMAGTDSAKMIRAHHEDVAQLRSQLGMLHFESILATREVLNPQQRQKFAEIVKTD